MHRQATAPLGALLLACAAALRVSNRTLPATTELRVKHPFTITYSVLSSIRIPYTYANRPGNQGAWTGAQHETNVTASVRHCAFINGRIGACPTAPARLELAARPHGFRRGLAAQRRAWPQLHATGAAGRLARRYCEQCAHAARSAARRRAATPLTCAASVAAQCEPQLARRSARVAERQANLGEPRLSVSV